MTSKIDIFMIALYERARLKSLFTLKHVFLVFLLINSSYYTTVLVLILVFFDYSINFDKITNSYNFSRWLRNDYIHVDLFKLDKVFPKYIVLMNSNLFV